LLSRSLREDFFIAPWRSFFAKAVGRNWMAGASALENAVKCWFVMGRRPARRLPFANNLARKTPADQTKRRD
jgi:hypothetical protein